MSWFNYLGLIFMAVLMIPNIIFSMKVKDGFVNYYENKVVILFEEITRFTTFGLMVINIPFTYHGYWFENAKTVYIIVNAVLILLYCLVWIICLNKETIFRSLALSILPTSVFIFSGVMIISIPLITSSIIFAICHITISYQNTVLKANKTK